MHEDAAHDVADEDAGAVAGEIDAGAFARRALRKIGRPQEAVDARRELQRLALVPDVIAGGHHVGAGRQRFAIDLLGDAEAARRVLAIDDHEVELEVGNEARQALPHGGAAGTPHHVAQEKKSHIPF